MKEWQLRHNLLGYLTQTYGAFSPHDTTIVAPSWDQTVRIYDLRSGRIVQHLMGHTGHVRYAAFSMDGNHVVTMSPTVRRGVNAGQDEFFNAMQGDATVRIWAVDSGCEVFKLEFTELNCAHISRDGQVIVTSIPEGCAGATCGSVTHVWDRHSGRRVPSFVGHEIENQRPLAISPDGAYVVSQGEDRVSVWDRRDGTLLFWIATKRFSSAMFSPDASVLSVTFGDADVELWNVRAACKQSRLADTQLDVRVLGFSLNSQRILVAQEYGTRIIVYDSAFGRVVSELRHRKGGRWAGFSPEGDHVVTKYESNGAQVCCARTGRSLCTLSAPSVTGTAAEDRAAPGNGNYVFNTPSAAFSPTGDMILSGCTAIRVWQRANSGNVREGNEGKRYASS